MALKIKDVCAILLSIPFKSEGSGEGIMPTPWTELEFCLVKIETDQGLIGWGEAFSYSCSRSVAAFIRQSIAPLLVGQSMPDPVVFGEQAQHKLILQGRSGVAMFALSGIDLALWDLKAKADSTNVAQLLGGRCRESIRAYASLIRYGNVELVASACERVLNAGFKEFKLHEVTLPEIRRGAQLLGKDNGLMVDVNCNWTENHCREVIPALLDLNVRWLEEPIFPPENVRTLALLRETGIKISTGENACTAYAFEEICRAGASDFLQPSVTKVGGLSEVQKILKTTGAITGLPFTPHSPYFGPGFLATLQLAAAVECTQVVEYLDVEPERWIYQNMPLPVDGIIRIPDGVGMGMDPDPWVLNRYHING